ncbi:hypothetical protein DUI87_09614 [Hirundo rustica rustica]|uniref:Uncharacterized protein n=1 Tax=Hirundo rustica rustica TaxID=333673 RepID=A0A3M0L5H1_HIRRU|nr:hypothetical protein DUI87_09614 [Hirundo rustica rustica]
MWRPNKNEARKEDEPVMLLPEKKGSDGGKEENGREDREDNRDAGSKGGILLVDHIQWPAEDLERGCSLTAELMESFRRVFVDRKGGSSSLVSSQPAEANFIASTAWPETYAVAEAKFFRHVARQVPCESLHLKCLQVFTCILRATGFSSSSRKTVVMQVLTTVPLSTSAGAGSEGICAAADQGLTAQETASWAYLRRCLQSKRLEHFVLGNERLPAEISLPLAVRRLERSPL